VQSATIRNRHTKIRDYIISVSSDGNQQVREAGHLARRAIVKIITIVHRTKKYTFCKYCAVLLSEFVQKGCGYYGGGEGGPGACTEAAGEADDGAVAGVVALKPSLGSPFHIFPSGSWRVFSNR
jgi:hypothetical protein